MAARLPNCAFCGESIARAARVVIDWRLTGAPRIGWHNDCAGKDPLFRRHVRDREQHRASPIQLIRAVLGRGDGRVVARAAFWRSAVARVPARAVRMAEAK